MVTDVPKGSAPAETRGSQKYFLEPTFREIVVRHVPEDVSPRKRRCENIKHRKVKNAWLITSSAPTHLHCVVLNKAAVCHLLCREGSRAEWTDCLELRLTQGRLSASASRNISRHLWSIKLNLCVKNPQFPAVSEMNPHHTFDSLYS